MFFGSKPPPPPAPEEPIDYVSIAIAIFLCWGLPVILTLAANAREAAATAKVAKDAEGKTYVVVGASTGIGLELVKQLIARGSKVYATVRKPNAAATSTGATVIEGIDVTSDTAGALLASKLKGVSIDCLVCNAGSYDAGTLPAGVAPPALFGSQKLDAVEFSTMHKVYDLNCVGPLRVIKALHPQVTAPGGKIAIISTQMGSIDDNTSGGSYAYRCSKAAANMVGKGVAMDLKKSGVAVASIAPGFVVTNFGPGEEAMKKMGAKPVEPSVKGVVMALDALGPETTGTFLHANYGEGVKASKW